MLHLRGIIKQSFILHFAQGYGKIEAVGPSLRSGRTSNGIEWVRLVLTLKDGAKE